MVGTTASFFTNPHEFAAVDKGGCRTSIVIAEPGPFRARLTHVRSSYLQLLEVEEWLARIIFVRPPSSSILIVLPSGSGPAQRWAGVPIRPDEILTLRAVPGVFAQTGGHCRTMVICCAASHLARVGTRLSGPAFGVPDGPALWRPTAPILASLTSLHHGVMRVTGGRLSAPANPDAAHGLEQQVIEALVECLSGTPVHSPGSSRGSVEAMARLQELLQARPGTLLSPKELAVELNLSQRTLRAYCKGHLGLSPMRYLRLHQMQKINQDLRDGYPGAVSVAALAHRHGITELGRFARRYREAFGELPSETLHRRE